MSHTSLITSARRIIIKVGSRLLASRGHGINTALIERIARETGQLLTTGRQVLIVSSGAIISGLEVLGLAGRPRTLPLKQAAAAVGQSRLMHLYETAFARHHVKVGQVLLSHTDLTNRARFLNARNTLLSLLTHRVVPIINENDTVAVEEIQFGDNDTLASLVTTLVDAQLLIIYSDVDGLYDGDPRTTPHARLLPLVEEVTPAIERLAGKSRTQEGTGGMHTKIQAAKYAAVYGVATLILNGTREGLLAKVLAGESAGTLFLPRRDRLPSRKHWIAYTLRTRGRLHLDRGAVAAMKERGTSLLPSGITTVEGGFRVGDAVACVAPSGVEFARGLVNYSAEQMAKICGVKSSEIARLLGHKSYDEVIHRDNLVLL